MNNTVLRSMDGNQVPGFNNVTNKFDPNQFNIGPSNVRINEPQFKNPNSQSQKVVYQQPQQDSFGSSVKIAPS